MLTKWAAKPNTPQPLSLLALGRSAGTRKIKERVKEMEMVMDLDWARVRLPHSHITK